jgi:hypothetical protein
MLIVFNAALFQLFPGHVRGLKEEEIYFRGGYHRFIPSVALG